MCVCSRPWASLYGPNGQDAAQLQVETIPYNFEWGKFIQQLQRYVFWSMGKSIWVIWASDNVAQLQVYKIPKALKWRKRPGGWINIKMSSYQYRKSHCGDKTILRPSYLHNGISYTGKMTSLYWIRAQWFKKYASRKNLDPAATIYYPWASLFRANGQMIMTWHNHRSSQLHRISSGVNPPSGLRDMGSKRLHRTILNCTRSGSWASPYGASSQTTTKLHNYRSRKCHSTSNGFR